MCGFPNNVPHARHNADETPDRQDFAIDSVVEYECFVGYEARGFSKAKCLYYNGTAQWFGPDLKCIRELLPSIHPSLSLPLTLFPGCMFALVFSDIICLPATESLAYLQPKPPS